MEVQFTVEQETQLAQLAHYAGKSDAVDLLKDAALRLLGEDARFRAAMPEGTEYADRSEFIEGMPGLKKCSAPKCVSAGRRPQPQTCKTSATT